MQQPAEVGPLASSSPAYAATGAAVGARSWSGGELRALGEALLYLAPSLILLVVFVFIPLARGVYLSLFYTTPLGNPSTFAGLGQYAELLGSRTFWTGLMATFLFVLYTVPAGIFLSLLLAVLVNQRLRGINVFRTLLSSTIAVSAAVGSLICCCCSTPVSGCSTTSCRCCACPAPTG
jgi:ABC-type sugar transport system permease subunit